MYTRTRPTLLETFYSSRRDSQSRNIYEVRLLYMCCIVGPRRYNINSRALYNIRFVLYGIHIIIIIAADEVVFGCNGKTGGVDIIRFV